MLVAEVGIERIGSYLQKSIDFGLLNLRNLGEEMNFFSHT